jgi:hypothetical protein
MTFIAANASTSSNRFDAIFSVVIASSADFCAGARQGREIELRYRNLDRRSGPDLARLGLTRSEIAQVALSDAHH